MSDVRPSQATAVCQEATMQEPLECCHFRCLMCAPLRRQLCAKNQRCKKLWMSKALYQCL
eukprot:3850517-Karenia_brevis.AAC.1